MRKLAARILVFRYGLPVRGIAGVCFPVHGICAERDDGSKIRWRSGPDGQAITIVRYTLEAIAPGHRARRSFTT